MSAGSSRNNGNNVLDAARAYLARAWHCVPLYRKTKKPVSARWEELRLEADDLQREFCGDRNIGLLLGEPSHGLAGVDLDCTEALRLAAAFLPPTGAIFGRLRRPQSHWLYQVTPTNFRTTQFRDPTCGKVTSARC
jgi:hypothetical protein